MSDELKDHYKNLLVGAEPWTIAMVEEEIDKLQRENERLLKIDSERTEVVFQLVNDLAELSVFVEGISKQSPIKPDHWSTCGRCERNIEEAQEILDRIRERYEKL